MRSLPHSSVLADRTLRKETKKAPPGGGAFRWLFGKAGRDYIMPPMPPMPPMSGIGAAGLSSGSSATIASVVTIMPAIDAAC